MKKKPTKSGYRPSDSVKKRIAAWEGSAMTGAIDPLSGKWGKNRSFEEEANSFYHALPADIREQVISNPGLADNLFSYSYNVGAGRFKERVVPALRKYYAGKGSAEEIASSMWASGDKKLRGLRNRRAVERQGVVDSLAPSPIQPVFDVLADNTFVFNPFPIHAESTTVAPIMVPDTYVEAHRLTPSEDRVNKFQEAMEARRQYNNLMDAISIQNNPAPQYTPQNNPVNAPYVVASYDKGGYLRKSWNDLSMSEKAEMMKVAVRNGITNLQDIRDKYNEFAEGGDTDWSYNSWKRQIAEHMGIRPDEDNTYDYEAYFRKYPKEAWKMLSGDPTAHFSDEFKTVYHPTFSSKSIGNDGSIYSGVRNPKTNPQGLIGGTWSPDYHTFTMSPDGYRGPVSMDDRKWYLENNEDNGVVLREADGSLPVYDGIPWGGVLPNVTIYGNKHSLGGPLVEAAMNEYRNGGKIHIKPSHRGRLTDLKKRTGKTEAELYNDGNPAHKKMVVFARSARKWKHGLGGNLFSGEEEGSQQMETGQYKPGYSYTYSHKTTKGHTLSIKNDKVFLDGRPAPEGYRWFDRNNGNNYIVKNGVWVSEKLHGKDYNAPSNRHVVFNNRNNNIDEEKTGVSRLMREGIKEQQRRLNIENQYYTPVDYPGVKTAKITTGKTFNGIEIPYNVLDSVAKYAPIVGIPEEKAYGLLGETSGGKYPFYTADLSSTELAYYTRTPDYQLPKYPNKEIRGIFPTDLMNNHNYYLNNPFYAEIGQFIRKKGLNGEVAPEGTVSIFQAANEEQNALADERYPYILKSMVDYSSDNPWINAFEYLRDHNYNMGKGYQKTTESRGLELMADPAFKEYKKLRNK